MTTVLHVLPHRGGGAERYLDLLEQIDGFTHERVALSDGRTPAAAAVSLPRRLPAIARAARHAGVVHAHGDAATILALPALWPRASVWTTHGLHLLRRHPRIAPGVRAGIAATRVTLCTSRAEHDELLALAPRRAERLVIARNGLPAAPAPDPGLRAAVRAELGLAPHETAILFLGELSARKAPLDAVAAVGAARERDAAVVLLVAGDGPLRSAVESAAGPAVRPLGFRDDPERLLAAADVFVLPSAREGLSFAILEAMQAGLACVVADGAGNPEAVADAGVVVPAGDRQALADTLARLARDPAERTRLGAAARERVATTFSATQLLDAVAAAYERALTAPAPTAAA